MVIKLRYGIINLSLLLIFIITIFFASPKSNSHEKDTESGAIHLPIIMYHEVKTYKLGKDVISPNEFETDLKYLTENKYTTITMTDLVDYVYDDKKLPENPIILSFDDGYLNNYKYVLPLLKKYNMKIVFSIIGKNTDDFTMIPDKNPDYSHVTWDELNEMLRSGNVEVQNHTYNMHSMLKNGRIGCKKKFGESDSHYEQVMIADIGTLQEKITTMTGKTPNTFAYPYGISSKNTDSILKSLNFKASLSCKYGINEITKNPEKLFGRKRVCRSHNHSIEKVLKQATETLK